MQSLTSVRVNVCECKERGDESSNTPPRTMYTPQPTLSVLNVHKLGHDCVEGRCSQRLGQSIGDIFCRGKALRDNHPFFGQLPGKMVGDLDVFVRLVVHWIEDH